MNGLKISYYLLLALTIRHSFAALDTPFYFLQAGDIYLDHTSLCSQYRDQRKIQLEDKVFIGICDAEDLVEINSSRENLARNYLLLKDIELSSFYQGGGEQFLIGSGKLGLEQGKFFHGVFEGNGYTISGFRYQNNNNSYFAGLFGTCANATIKNLRLEDVKINAGNYTGSLVGKSFNCRLENIIARDVSIQGHTLVGALVGTTYYDKQDKEEEKVVQEHLKNGLINENPGIYNIIIAGDVKATAHMMGGIVGQNMVPLENIYQFVTLKSRETGTGLLIGRTTDIELNDIHIVRTQLDEESISIKLKTMRNWLPCDPKGNVLQKWMSYRFCINNQLPILGNYYHFDQNEINESVHWMSQEEAKALLNSLSH